MQGKWRFLQGALLVVLLTGCNVSRPRWFDPGSQARQRQTAQQFDPYPEQDIAPEALGTRPPGFETNVPETQRARWWERFGWGSGGEAQGAGS